MGALIERMEWIKECMEELNSILEELSIEKILNKLRYLAMVLYLLQSSIQALIDMGTRLLSQLGFKPPAAYGEIPEKLHSIGVLESNEMEEFRKMVGFRNIVVHGYIGIDKDRLSRVLINRLYLSIYDIALKIINFAKSKGIDP